MNLMNGKVVAVLVGLLVLAGVGYFVFSGNNEETEVMESENAMVEDSSEKMEEEKMEGDDAMMEEDGEKMEGKEYSLDDISSHDNKDDCWFAIEGKVYDVTEYIAGAKHPGGEAILEGCGIDATELFNTRPMGSGTPHSSSAKAFAEKYIIGSLAE